jgi:hypothetical protein
LFSLNQDSAFMNCALVVLTLVFIDGLPPKPTVCTLGVPSANAELIRTLPFGRVTYGDELLCDWFTPSDVSVRMPKPK